MTPTPATGLADEFTQARRALNDALDHATELDGSAADAGRRYLRAKVALIADILDSGDIDTPTHRYTVRWDFAFRCWRLVVTPFLRFPSLAARKEVAAA